MANGSTRTVQAQMVLGRESAQKEQERLLALSKKGSKVPKIPLKNPTKNNHSK